MSNNRQNDNSAAGQGSNKASLPIVSKASYIDQSAVVYDLISEGEIEGLTDGAYSIYLNNVPVLDNSRKDTYSAKSSSNVSYVASSGVTTDNQSSNMFDGLSTSDGSRFIRIDGGAATGAVNVSANVATITPSSSGGITFANTHVKNNSTTLIDMQPKIRIANAGKNNGTHVATITSFDSSNGTVQITPPPEVSVNNATATIDLVDEVGGISGNTCTISPSGQGINRSNVSATMSSPIVSDSGAPIYNVDNFSYEFRTGHRNQSFVVAPEGVGTGAVGISINQDLGGCSKAALGMGSEPRILANLDDHAGDTLTSTAINDTGVTIASTSFGLADVSSIDQLKITINFPQGLFTNDRTDGDSGSAWCEFKIAFEYVRDGQTFTETVFGVDDMSTIPREKQGTRPGSPFSATVHNGIVYRKTATQFLTTFSFDTERFQPFDSFNIKVLRYTPDPYEISNKLYNNVSQVSYVEAIIEDKLNYPYSAYAAVMVDSKDYTTVPTRSYEIRGIKCKVPTNYVPRDTLDSNGNRTSSASYKRNISTGVVESSYQDWDGKFRGDKKDFPDADNVNHLPVYTNNPAWIFYDLLTNARYGLGSYLYPDGISELIDIYSLYELAQYCDEEVPDGKGGTEPRFALNCYISKQSEAIKVLKDLITTFRGMMLWHNGQVVMSIQQDKAPIFTFAKSNVVGGVFNYQYSAKRVRANQIRVTWNDPDNNYKPAVEVVEDTDNVAKEGRIVSKQTVAFGCTSQSQAHRVGKFHLLTEILDDEAVSFVSGIGGQILRPGDLIEVQDSDKDNVQLSGRVSSGATTTVIPVDRSVALSNTANADLTLIFPKSGAYLSQPEATIDSVVYKLGDLILQAKNSSNALYNIDDQVDISNARDDSGDKIQIAWSEDARIETKAISSYNASHVVVSSAFSAAPDQETIFAITQTTAEGEELAGSPVPYMVSEITENEDKTFAISAIKHTTGKYDMIDRGWSVPTVPDVMRPPKGTDGVPSPRNFAIRLQKGIADNSGDEKTTNAYEERFAPPRLDIYWGAPLSLRTDDNNTNIQGRYEHIQSYEVSHNLYSQVAEAGKESFDTITLSGDKSTHTFENVPKGGKYIFRIRTVATNGAKSPAVQRVITINPEKPAKQLEPKIRFGGALTSEMSIASANGLVSLTDSTYNMTPAEAEIPTYIVTSGTTAQTSQSFASLANGNTAYMLHDYSDATDPWKAIEYILDTTGSATFRYAKQVGVDAFTQKTGTANTVTGNTIIVGTNTAFTNEYQAGDLFVFDAAGSTRHISTINHIHSNTELELSHPPTANLTNKNIFAQSLQPNFIKDTIIGEVANTSGTFSLINYASGNRGRDSYTISLTNEAHSFPADKDGNVSSSNFNAFTSSATVLKGTTAQSYASSGTALNTFGMTISASTNCTATINTGSGVITVSAMTADTASITLAFTDRYAGISIGSKAISLTKSRAGDDGTIGSDGKRSVQGYLYYEKTTSGAPSAPGSSTYTFATGDIDGGSGATEVLALTDTSAVDKWTNEPRTQDPTSSNVHWTVRYSGTEASAGAATCTVAYSSIVQYTNFTGVVTFSGGTFKDGGTNITTIDGGNISTGTITANKLNVSTLSAVAANVGTLTAGTIVGTGHSGTSDGSGFSTAGLAMNLASGTISSKQFRIGSDGSAAFKGDLSAATITIGQIASFPDTGAMNTATSTAHGQANTATTNAASAHGQANTATTNAAAAQSTADSKVTHAAVNTASTIVGGGVGGWAITQYHLAGGAQASATTRDFTVGTSTSGNATFLANGGVILGSDGFLSSNTFYIDTAGNAKFKGTLEGDDVTVNGTLVLPSAGANNSSVGGFSVTNSMQNKFIASIGTGAGFYSGYVRLVGGTNHVKTISIQIRTGTSDGSQGTLVYETPRIDLYTAGNLPSARLYSSAQTANMPIVFSYTGSSSLAAYVRGQADSATDTISSGEARFIKFGTTDPVYSFANQTGVALSTAVYSNTQVVGGFAGTKTVSISNTSFTRYKIDGGSFGTASQQIANGSYINVEITSAASNQTTRSTDVSIGTSLKTFQVITGGTGGGGDDDDGDDGGDDEDEEASFVQGTPVVMSDGTTKAIESIAIGDVVKSFKHSSLDASNNDAWKTWTTPEIADGSFGTATVTSITGTKKATEYYWINYNLKVTANHPMVVFKDNVFKFVTVSNIAVGDYIVNEDGTLEEIFANDKVTVNCLAYNFDVETDDTYIVRGGNDRGYIAHNKEIA